MIESSARLGRHRWTIERTGAWLGGFRRLRIRYARCSERNQTGAGGYEYQPDAKLGAD
jgi:transposase